MSDAFAWGRLGSALDVQTRSGRANSHVVPKKGALVSSRPLDSVRDRLPGWVGAARAASRRSVGEFVLRAPGGTVSVHRDPNGYPSIIANDRVDAAWAKGWLHARDRLGQVRLTVLAAQGRMMELLGDTPLTRTVDRATRLLDLRRGLHEQVKALSFDSRRIVEAYCAGFEAGQKGRPFSRFLDATGVDIGPYTPEHVLLTYRMICFFGLTSFQQIAEMIVAELVQDGADEATVRLFLGDRADGIDLDAIRAMRIPDELALLATPSPLGGSNAFAVDGKRSATGGALMMSEAHMEVARFPPIFYISHEKYADGEYYQGVCVPGTPWVTMGRTRYVGWTYTFGHADNVDVLIERCKDGRYETPSGWQPFRKRESHVSVRGAESETWTFWENEYGTLAADDCTGDLPCVRWTGLHDATAGDVEATLSSHDCRNVDDLVEAHRRLHTISLGAVLGDRDGRIAYVHTGRVDQRPDDWTGAYPRPAHDREARIEVSRAREDLQRMVVAAGLHRRGGAARDQAALRHLPLGGDGRGDHGARGAARERGRELRRRVAAAHGTTAAAVSLAWLLARPEVS